MRGYLYLRLKSSEEGGKIQTLKGPACIVTVETTDISQQVQKRQMRVETAFSGAVDPVTHHSAGGAYTL